MRTQLKFSFFSLLIFLAFLVLGNLNRVFAGAYGSGLYGNGIYGQLSNTASSASPCTDQSPGSIAPWLYSAAAQDSYSILLGFKDWSLYKDKFILEYGTETGKYKFSADNISKDSINFLVEKLNPNTTYYFRIRSNNGCATGPWSNELSAKTLEGFGLNNLKISKTDITQSPSIEGYKINIMVKDANGNPIENAIVTLHSDPQTAKTDKNGQVAFSNIEPGDHTVQVIYNDYKGEESINLAGESGEFNLNITVEPQNPFSSPKVSAVIILLSLIIIILSVKLIQKRRLKRITAK